ncbi:hypothetical protein COV82_02585 [Candidatus Peregrinibacteria bacterium CG11_big_fil_rev_8_21_14_0_20_46_8]|nr:MAG: hypothetical protein COV82_02585 [Candidatus Peregrinibacteria bacterium CG11_big_fil_rev_8_21_14_0_20_46_8]
MSKYNQELHGKLQALLEKVQREKDEDIYIYGITNTQERSFLQKIDDFLIDHSTVKATEKAQFFGLLSTMLGSGISINKSLKLLRTKTTHPRLRRIIATLSYELEHGRTLSQSMERFADVFTESERGSLKSAEATGNLEPILHKNATALERRTALSMKIKSALIYPVAVIVTLIAGIATMLVWVVPRIKEIFSQSDLPLPFSTKILLSMSEWTISYWWVALLLIFLGISAFLVYTNAEEGKFSWDFMKLRIPVVGTILRKVYVLRFVDTLGVLIDSGVSITNALELTAEAIGNEIYRVKTYESLARVQEGVQLSSTLMEAPFLFPATVANMIAIAEQSASIGDISRKISEHYDREIGYTLRNMTTTLGPVMILITGIGVGLFALAVLSPIFSLTQTI